MMRRAPRPDRTPHWRARAPETAVHRTLAAGCADPQLPEVKDGGAALRNHRAMNSARHRQTQARRPRRQGARGRAWLHALLVLVFLAVGMPGGHAMAGVDAPAHAGAMADCDGCAGVADAGPACTASLTQLPATLALVMPQVAGGGSHAPAPLPASRYRSPDLDAPRQPPRAA